MTLKELEEELKELRAEGATDSTPVRFATAPGVEAQLLSLYYVEKELKEIWFDVEEEK